MSKNLALALLVFVPFTAFSSWVILEQGILGFLPAALDGRWGTQVFLDLVISLTLASNWLLPDARRRGINPWPFVLSALGLGSIAFLGYLVFREVRAVSRPQPAAA